MVSHCACNCTGADFFEPASLLSNSCSLAMNMLVPNCSTCSLSMCSRHDFPLRGFAKCGCCAEQLAGSWSKGRNRYYACYHIPTCRTVWNFLRTLWLMWPCALLLFIPDSCAPIGKSMGILVYALLVPGITQLIYTHAIWRTIEGG